MKNNDIEEKNCVLLPIQFAVAKWVVSKGACTIISFEMTFPVESSTTNQEIL